MVSNFAKERFADKGAISVPIVVFVIGGEVVHGEDHAYEVTKCFKFDSKSVAWTGVEEMSTCIDTFIVWNVRVGR